MQSEEIKQKIRNDPEYTVGALITLYKCQNGDERSSGTTAELNGLGFSKVDARFLTDVSKFYLRKGFLTDNQIARIRPLLLKYSKQLSRIGLEPAKLGRRVNRKNKQKNEYVASIYNEDQVKLKFPFSQDLNFKVKGINGHKFRKKEEEKFWTIPLTLINVEKVVEWGFELSSDLQKWYDEQNVGVTSDISVPGLDDVLRPFQKEAVSKVEHWDGRALIADDMGLGKTLESIAWLQYRHEDVFPILIICPASLKYKWLEEFKKFTKDAWKHVEILEGLYPYEVNKSIAVVNYDILAEISRTEEGEDGKKIKVPVEGSGWAEYLAKNFRPKTVVADELHKCKNYKAKRTEAVRSIFKKAKFRIGLTGTPIDNKPKEIYPQLMMIKPTLFPNWLQFGFRYCGGKTGKYGRSFEGATNLTELNQILTKECFTYDTTITLEKNGQKPIGEVVENEINDRVLSYNFETSEIQWRQIEAHSASPIPNKLVRIKHESGEFTCTPDHPIWTEEKGYVRAEEITSDLSLLVLQDSENSNS